MLLKELHYEPSKGRVLFHTRYNQYFGENIPPKGVQYIRRYGLYASRTRGKWTEHPEIIKHAPFGWKASQQECLGNEKTFDEEESEVTDRTSRKAWHGY